MQERTKFPCQRLDQFPIRMPDGWRDAIKAQAAKNRCSMNAEILNAIETAMRIKGVALVSADQK